MVVYLGLQSKSTGGSFTMTIPGWLSRSPPVLCIVRLSDVYDKHLLSEHRDLSCHGLLQKADQTYHTASFHHGHAGLLRDDADEKPADDRHPGTDFKHLSRLQ